MAQIDRRPARSTTPVSQKCRNPRKLNFVDGQSAQAFALPGRRYGEPIERIIANSVVSQESAHEGEACWLWLGNTSVNRSGQRYGRINVWARGKHKKMFVHRYVVTFVKGRRLTRRDVVKHLCNNTMCRNPAHVIGGTQSSNMKQCVRDGRHNSQQRKAA